MKSLLSGATNYGAAIFLYILGVIFAGVVATQMILRMTVSPEAMSYIGLVVGYAINSHGISQGTSQTNDTVSKTAAAQLPLIASNEARTVSSEEAISSNSARLDVLEKGTNIHV